MRRSSAAAVLFDPSKQTLAWSLLPMIDWGERKSARSFYLLSRHRYIEARGKHDESSRTSVVIVSLCTLFETQKLLVATTPFGTFAFGMLAELLNDSTVRDVLMSMYSVSDPRRCLCCLFSPLVCSH